MPVKCPWYRKYLNIKGRAKERGLTFTLSLDDYKQLASQVGITCHSQIGRTSGKYVMARLGDVGGYTLGNCRFIPREQNDREAVLNNRYAKVSKARTGTNKRNDIGRAMTSIKLAKSFEVKSPTGLTYKGDNLKEFCKTMGLDQGNMSRVCSGEQAHYKYWTGKYV